MMTIRIPSKFRRSISRLNDCEKAWVLDELFRRADGKRYNMNNQAGDAVELIWEECVNMAKRAGDTETETVEIPDEDEDIHKNTMVYTLRGEDATPYGEYDSIGKDSIVEDSIEKDNTLPNGKEENFDPILAKYKANKKQAEEIKSETPEEKTADPIIIEVLDEKEPKDSSVRTEPMSFAERAKIDAKRGAKRNQDLVKLDYYQREELIRQRMEQNRAIEASKEIQGVQIPETTQSLAISQLVQSLRQIAQEPEYNEDGEEIEPEEEEEEETTAIAVTASPSVSTIPEKKEFGNADINRIIDLFKTKTKQAGIQYTADKERIFAKHLLTAKAWLEFCKEHDTTPEHMITEMIRVGGKSPYTMSKVSGPQKLYFGYPSIYNSIKADLVKQQQEQKKANSNILNC